MIEIGVEVLDALAAAHAEGLVHRDVKPSNIMLDREGQARLIDFGLAKHAEPAGALTRPNAVLGTPGYMAPEQIAGQAPTPASDLFCLGVVLYELLTGQRPFQGQTDTALAFSILYEAPPNLRDLAPHVPGPLTRVVQRALAKDPADRFAGAADMARALREVPDQATAQGHPPAQPAAASPDDAPVAPLATPTGRRRMRSVLLAFAAVLLAALGVWALLPGRSPSDGRPRFAASQPETMPAGGRETVAQGPGAAARGTSAGSSSRPGPKASDPHRAAETRPTEGPVVARKGETRTPPAVKTPHPRRPVERNPALDGPMIDAAAGGDLERAKWLLDHGADVNAKHPGYQHPGATIRHPLSGCTALRIAYKNGQKEMVTFLLERGADPDAVPGTGGCTLLHLAAQAGHVPTAKALLAHGAQIDATHRAHPNAPIRDRYAGYTALRYAYDAGKMEMVRFLLSSGANPDVKPWRSGYTLLHLAAQKGDVEFVKLLLTCGADPSIRSSGRPSRTALQHAIAAGHTQVAEILMARDRHDTPHGPGKPRDTQATTQPSSPPPDKTPEVTKPVPKTPQPDPSLDSHLLEAAGRDDVAKVRWLLQRGAQIEATDITGRRPLRVAYSARAKKVFALLLAEGADPNSPRKGMRGSVLHLAARKGDKEAADLLLSYGADIEAQDVTLCTPLTVAARAKQWEMVALLLERGANPNPAPRGSTLLHTAAKRGDLDTVKLLLSYGAKADAKDVVSKTPADYAVARGHKEVAHILMHPERVPRAKVVPPKRLDGKTGPGPTPPPAPTPAGSARPSASCAPASPVTLLKKMCQSAPPTSRPGRKGH